MRDRQRQTQYVPAYLSHGSFGELLCSIFDSLCIFLKIKHTLTEGTYMRAYMATCTKRVLVCVVNSKGVELEKGTKSRLPEPTPDSGGYVKRR